MSDQHFSSYERHQLDESGMHDDAVCHACALELREMNEPNSIVKAIDNVINTAVALQRCLWEFEDQPECCSEYSQAFDSAVLDFDNVRGFKQPPTYSINADHRKFREVLRAVRDILDSDPETTKAELKEVDEKIAQGAQWQEGGGE